MKKLISIACVLIVALATNALAKEVDSLVVFKAKRQLLLYSQGKIFKTYKVALGKKPVGPKEKLGDKKTPEGRYVIDGHNPNSLFHKSIGISYPNKQDKALGRTGGDIKIHGLKIDIGKLHLLKNWTQGCIAVTNHEMDYIYDHVANKTPIFIYP
jgi:murein L,D-transpeptidase YafK